MERGYFYFCGIFQLMGKFFGFYFIYYKFFFSGIIEYYLLF